MSEESNQITIHVTMPSGEESKTIHVDKVYYCNNNNHEF